MRFSPALMRMALPSTLLAAALVANAQEKKNVNKPEWIVRSDNNAQVLIAPNARFHPEAASSFGVETGDDQIVDLKPGYRERYRTALENAGKELQPRLESEKEPLVRQDLEILLKSDRDNIKQIDLSEKYDIPYFNISRTVFSGIRALLDDQVSPERRKIALIRLRKYAGMEPGYEPVTQLAEARTREKLNTPGLLGPYKGELEKDLATSPAYVNGVGQLFQKFQLTGYEEPLARLKQEMAQYDDFIRKELMPKARTDFRLPPEQYAFRFVEVGIDAPPDQVAAMGHETFNQLQKQMQELAPKVSKQHGWNYTDYRDVIKALKKDQWPGQTILPEYKQRISEVEDIIRREHLVTLPQRPMRIRLASEAEAAQTPAPNMHPPRLIGNTGEAGEFVLPLNIPGNKAGEQQKFDDFTNAAASWTLVAHEGRPGHELQFDSMLEHGVSIARGVFAFNSVNVEGWGLYAEAILLPYMPPDGQLLSLDYRLWRAARAFLDPELQSGKVTPEQAHKVLTDDVVLSDAMANSEVERYMFWMPGQAPSYFYGYTKLMALRQDTEKALGPKFNQQKFHDFVLSQGLLPPNLLRKAVTDEFIPAQRGKRVAEVPGAVAAN